MYYYNYPIYIYILCTLQLQPYLLTMASKQSAGRPNQAVTLFAPVGVAEDLSKTQFILCGEIKQELKILKESIAAIPFQELKSKYRN